MLRFVLVVLLLVVPIVSGAEDLAIHSDEGASVESPSVPRHDFSQTLGRLASGEVEANPKTRRQLAKNMLLALSESEEYKGIKVSAEGQNATVLKLSFNKANGLIATAIASQPDIVLAFYALGFKKMIFSNNSGDTWVFPVKPY